MIQLGEKELAKYPFLADAGAYLRGYGFTLEQLAGDPDLEAVRKKAFERVYTASRLGQVYRPDIDSHSALPMEVLSFLLAIVLLKMSRANYLVQKFAMQEARGAESFLAKDLGRATTDIEVGVATKIVWDLAQIRIAKRDQDFVISVPEYLRRAAQFHAREWKLINRRVEAGQVFLNPRETVRLIRQEMVNYISSRISAAAMPPPVPGLDGVVRRLASLNEKFRPQIVRSNKTAPCIEHAINTLANGKNLSHAGRFMLATYMLERGRSIEEIVPYFENAPDYNISITKYQLEHLAGMSGSNTRYRCQSCEKLRTLNLCHATSECAGVTNPTQFGAVP